MVTLPNNLCIRREQFSVWGLISQGVPPWVGFFYTMYFLFQQKHGFWVILFIVDVSVNMFMYVSRNSKMKAYQLVIFEIKQDWKDFQSSSVILLISLSLFMQLYKILYHVLGWDGGKKEEEKRKTNSKSNRWIKSPILRAVMVS